MVADLKPRQKVERVIFCSGGCITTSSSRKENNLTDAAAIIRIEQLYPLYKEKIARLAKPFINAKKTIWCQEEPENMGAWTFILPQLLNLFPGYIHYAGRPASASPAAGTIQAHQAQQAALVKQAFEV